MNPLYDELTAYIDGELSPERAAEVKAALETDPWLRAMEQRLRRSVEAVESLASAEVPVSANLRRAVLAAVDQPTWKEKWLTWPRLVPLGLGVAVAAAALVVVVPGAANDSEGGLDEEKLLLAQNLEVVEDLDVAGLESPADLDVVANLEELEALQ